MAYTTINDPSEYFNTLLYTGNGNHNREVIGTGFKPDWLWIKNRTSSGGAGENIVFDTTRGNTKDVLTNKNEAEHTNSDVLLSFDVDGFTVGRSGTVNERNSNFVAWQWKANGGTTSSNTDGDITSTVQANTDAGFSIISYTGSGTDGDTVGHGLNETPLIFFPKCLSTTTNWEMYYFPTGGTRQYGYLNLTNKFETWPHNAPSSTIISLSGSGDSNGNTRPNIGYAFHSVKGYSKIKTYTGNGNADGTYVYTGFRPAWLMVKNTSTAGEDWHIFDSKRSPSNIIKERLIASGNAAENANDSIIDFTSNGFKWREADSFTNDPGSSTGFIYAAWAEAPSVDLYGGGANAR